MISVRAAVRLCGQRAGQWAGHWAGAWADASHEQALTNARAASVVCSRARLERAEVEAYLAERLAPAVDLAARDLAARAEAASR